MYNIHALRDAVAMESSQKRRLKHMLIETIQVLCKNSLPDESSFCIEGTIGITLSSGHVMVISFKERIKSCGSRQSLMMADEHDSQFEQQQDKNTDEKKNQLNVSHTSNGRGDIGVQRSVSENPAVRECVETLQTRSSSSTSHQDICLPVTDVDDSTHVALFADTRQSAVNDYSVPTSDNCCTVTQSLAKRATDSQDGIVVFKVEEEDDVADTVAGMHQSSSEVAAPAEQCHLTTTSWEQPRVLLHEGFGGGVPCSNQRQTSCYVGASATQHTGDVYQPAAAFNASYSYVF